MGGGSGTCPDPSPGGGAAGEGTKPMSVCFCALAAVLADAAPIAKGLATGGELDRTAASGGIVGIRGSFGVACIEATIACISPAEESRVGASSARSSGGGGG